MTRFLRIALLIAPVIIMAVLFHEGATAWFQQDDFAHLKLAAATRVDQLPQMMVMPIAQGTFRPLSERLYFWSLYKSFGLNHIPFRLIAFALQSANAILLVLLLRRLTGSRRAALVGSVVWIINPCLTLPMTWIAATNQIMLTFCVLSAFLAFVVFVEQGNLRMLGVSWAFFAAGFGVLETIVALPALLTLYTLLFHRERLIAAALFWIPSLAFAALHLLLIPKQRQGVYSIQLGFGTLTKSLWTYWNWSWLLDSEAKQFGIPPVVGVLTASLVLLGFIALGFKRPANRLILFGLGWFALALGPVLPLGDHVSDYYLTLPLIGVAIAVATAFREFPKLTGVPLIAYFLLCMQFSTSYSRSFAAKSRNIEALMRGVEQIHAAQPDSTILLADIGDDLFWSGIYDNPFSLAGAPKTFLTPESAANLTPFPELFRAEDYTLPRPTVEALLEKNQARVYLVGKRSLTHVTSQYMKTARGTEKNRQPTAVHLAEPDISSAIGMEWYAPEEAFRWMPRSATVKLSGTGKEIVVMGFCAAEQLRDHRQLGLRGEWNNSPLGEVSVNPCPGDFSLHFPLPPGHSETGTLRLTTSSVVRVGNDLRDLGLAVRSIEIR